MEILLWILAGVLVASWLGVVLVGPPYVPTLQRELEKLFKELDIDENDCLVDLGAGDGRVLQLAAERGARVVGVEINPFLALVARWRLRRFGNSAVLMRNMWSYSLPAETTCVFVFPAQTILPKLAKYLQKQADDGRSFQVIVHAFKLPGIVPESTVGAFNLYRF